LPLGSNTTIQLAGSFGSRERVVVLDLSLAWIEFDRDNGDRLAEGYAAVKFANGRDGLYFLLVGCPQRKNKSCSKDKTTVDDGG
jgi:hypothetical protein